MKILASDYDGTLNVAGEVSQENKDAIAAWRAAGNLFGLVSGRNLGSIKRFLDRDNVPYDFMVGCNGAVITDAKGNATGHNCIPSHIAKAILSEIHRYEAYYVSASYDWGSVGVYSDTDVQADDMGLTVDGKLFDRVLEVSGTFTSPSHAQAVRDKCEAMFPGQIVGLMPTVQSIDFVCVGTNKASGIFKLSDCRGLSPEMIIAVGDGENDLSMLLSPDLCGYAMQSAMPVVLEKISRTTESVAALIREYL